MKKIVLFILVMSILTACTPDKLVVAKQYGLAYAPIEIMQAKGFLQEELPGRAVRFVQLANTASVRENMLAGKLDLAFVGIPPFLIGRDKGMDWQVVSGLCEARLGLVSRREITSLEQADNLRIALPQPGSIQHILLMMGAEKKLGDARRFDEQLISLSHPDATQAFFSGEVDMHYSAPPYLQRELASGGHLLLDGTESFGASFSFLIGITSDSTSSEEVQALRRALQRSIEYMVRSPEDSLAILSAVYGLTSDEILSQLAEMHFSTEIKGMDHFIDFMVTHGLLEHRLRVEDLLWQE